MKILIAVLDCIRWIASILLVVAIPFAWILRDGLGPDAKESTGFDAIVRTFSSAEVWILAFAFIALSAAVRFLSTHGASEKKAAKWSWRGAAYAFVVAFLLCLLGVIVFREWADRERQRKAEEYSEYMKCMDEALNQVIPSLSFEPPATFGDAIEFFDKCALNCLCKAGHDGMGRIRVVVADDVEMEELLKKPMPTIAVTDIKARDALRLVCEEFGCRFDINPYGRTITIYELIGCELYTTKVSAAEREQTINLPIAPHGDKLTGVVTPKKCLFADISVRDEKGALLPVPRALIEGESLSLENREIGSGDMAGALKRLTGKTLPGRDEFSTFIRADMECSHRCVASLINRFTERGIWDISIVARASGDSGDSQLVTFKILRTCPCVGCVPEEDAHIFDEGEPFDEEDVSIHCKKTFSLGQRLTFWVGPSADGSLDGAIVYCDKRVSLAELDGILANLAGNPETRGKAVSIKCAEESPHKALVNVLDILYKHNFKRVYLWTL